MFSPYNEFPHTVEVKSVTKTTDYSTHPPKVLRTEETKSLKAFMDGENTNDVVQYHQRNIEVTRFMFLPYGIAIGPEDVISFDGVKYRPSGALEDQGGQHLINRLPLKELS